MVAVPCAQLGEVATRVGEAGPATFDSVRIADVCYTEERGERFGRGMRHVKPAGTSVRYSGIVADLNWRGGVGGL